VVAAGAERPLTRDLLTAQEVHGADGLGGRSGSLPEPRSRATGEPAVEVLTRIPLEHPGEVTLVTTGPLTNVALALRQDPDALAAYERIISMGGAFDVPGNTGPVAEFNVYVDPEAAAEFLNSGLDITLVPLDATTRAVLTRAELAGRERVPRLPADAPGRDAPAILYRALDHYMEFQFDESGLDGGYMHDPLAVAAALDGGILETSTLDVDVVTAGPERGRTVRRLKKTHTASQTHGVRVAFGHCDAAFKEMLAERVLRPVFGDPRPR
jgi:purine nucleosidase